MKLRTICKLFKKPLNMQFAMISYKEVIHMCKKPFWKSHLNVNFVNKN